MTILSCIAAAAIFMAMFLAVMVLSQPVAIRKDEELAAQGAVSRRERGPFDANAPLLEGERPEQKNSGFG